jgi:hypothetical protein
VRRALLSLGSQPLIKFCPRAHLNLMRDPDPHEGNMARAALLRRVGGINDWQSERDELSPMSQSPFGKFGFMARYLQQVA